MTDKKKQEQNDQQNQEQQKPEPGTVTPEYGPDAGKRPDDPPRHGPNPSTTPSV